MAGGGLKFSVSLSGFREMEKKLKTAYDDGPSLFGGPWRQALDAMGRLGEQSAISKAPLGPTGRTIALMSYRVQKVPMPRYVVVKTTARDGRFSYPRFTNYSKFASRIHPNTKAGAQRRAKPNPHRYWFNEAMKRVIPAMNPILQIAKAKIEQAWAR